MAKLQEAFILLLIAGFTVGCSDNGPKAAPVEEAPAPASGTVDPVAEAAQPSLIIDVRSQEEWDEGHLQAAVLIPLAELGDRIGDVAKAKDQKIYLHCRSGGRAGRGKQQLEELGYTNVENVGGLDDARAKFESEAN